MEMEEELDETLENSRNSTVAMGRNFLSQPLIEKNPWGRMYKKSLNKDGDYDFVDIRGESYKFGRDPKRCDYVFQKEQEVDLKTWNRITKVHFELCRDLSSKDAPICIKDLSRNGTFVNGELIGLNQTQIIRSGDKISIVENYIEIFVFKDLINRFDLPQEIQKKYFVRSKLGSGAFGTVYKLLDHKAQPFAVKYIKRCSLATQQNSSENEIKIMKQLKHVCIIQIIDIMMDPLGGASLILEYMGGGDLFHRIINSQNGRLSEDHSRFMFFQITEAVIYLHEKGITHRDIKPENVLLKDNSMWPLVKLTDFGLSKFVMEGIEMKSLCGTPNYIAPEVLSSEETKYTSKVDIWSMGVMLFFMLSGSLPVGEKYGDYSLYDVSLDAMRLIAKILDVDPETRLNGQGILATPWMNRNHESIVCAIEIIEQYGDGGTLQHRI